MAGIRTPKKLIEVALPLDDINAEAAREKSIRHGHPSTLHLWWARRPLAAARAVLFAQLVNDPGGERGYKSGLTKAQAAAKREELFAIIRDLVKWENINNQDVLERARRAIRESWQETCAMNRGKPGFDPEHIPAFHDPFAGGGAIPLEAQRLGLESYASDLNPVAVMINKAMIEIPPRFRDSQPVGPLPFDERTLTDVFTGTQGLAEDVRRYGRWMREEAEKRIGHLYPKVEITADMAASRPDLKSYVGQKLTVIAWLWARTVKSPNPAFSHIDVPLVSSFILSKKKGKEAYIAPIIEGDSYHFTVKIGTPPPHAENGTKMARGAKFRCLLSDTPIPPEYIKEQFSSGLASTKLLAIVAEGKGGRVYLPPSANNHTEPETQQIWKPGTNLPKNPRWFSPPAYGILTFGDLFTPRQLVALNTFCDLVQEAKIKAETDAKAAGMPDDGTPLSQGGRGAKAYGEALSVYLSFAIDKAANYWSSLCSWHSGLEKVTSTFGRQALPMVWDFTECNPFSDSSGNFLKGIESTHAFFDKSGALGFGHAEQQDAQRQDISKYKIISTDPPYYDNIGYADLSDYFYVWMRRNLKSAYPNLFATISVPKAEELVATPYRHGSKEAAEAFFMQGMTDTMKNLASLANSAFPVTIYYAFKSSETKGNATSNTGWETFLEALLKAGFVLTGTWPMKTELPGNLKKKVNALASSIVLVCRKRKKDAPVISRRQFISELIQRMPEAMEDMVGAGGENSPVAPVDLAQAAIGPGMEIFSKYQEVLKADGSRMSVHEAMVEINRQISDYLNPSGSGFDAETLFCDAWYQQQGWKEGAFGEADVLARAKGTSVEYVASSGVATSKSGKVQLIHWRDYPEGYEPENDAKRSVWEACHHLIKALHSGGEKAAGMMLARMQESTEDIRQLAYHLYVYNERRGNAEEARCYNELMSCWGEIELTSTQEVLNTPVQTTLDL